MLTCFYLVSFFFLFGLVLENLAHFLLLLATICVKLRTEIQWSCLQLVIGLRRSGNELSVTIALMITESEDTDYAFLVWFCLKSSTFFFLSFRK